MANIAPGGTDSTITISEDTSYVFKAGDFGFTDVDANNLQSVIITAYSGTLTLNGLDVSLNNAPIPLASIPYLVWTPPQDVNGAQTGAVSFKVVDDGGTANGGNNTDPIANTVTFNVTAVNDAPIVTALINDQFAEQDNAFSFTIPTDAFDDVDGDALTFEVKVNGGALPPWLSFDDTTNILSGTPGIGDLGAYVLQIFAIDPGGKQAMQEVTLTVDDRNYAPSGTSSEVTIAEDQPYQFTIADFGFTDQDGDQMQSVLVTALPQFGSLTLDGVAVVAGQVIDATTIGSLVWTPPSNISGDGLAALAFQVIDDGTVGGNSVNMDTSPKFLVFNVAPANDAPIFSTPLPDAGVEIGTAFSIAIPVGSVTDADAEDVHTYTATLADGSALPDWITIDTANGTVSGEAPAGSEGSISIKVLVTDSGILVAEDDFTLTVSKQNLPPQGTDKTFTLLEDAVHVFTLADFGYQDGEGDSFDSVVITSLPTTGLLTFGDADAFTGQVIKVADIGNLSWTSPENQSGTGLGLFTFQVQASNGAGGVVTDSSANTISFDLGAVNDAPSGADKNIEVTEDVPYIFKVDDFGFSDLVENDNFVSVILAGLPGKGTLTLDGVAVTEGQEILAADIGKLAWATDKNAVGNAYATLAFAVKDSGGTANNGVDTDATVNILTFDITDIVDTFNGTKGKNSLVGSDGQDILNGKAGNDKLTGGAGIDTFIFRTGCDKDVVLDFDATGDDHDKLSIVRLDLIANFRDLKSHHMQQVGENVVINALNADVIILKNVKMSDLDAGDFIF